MFGKFHRFMEGFWLLVALVTLVMAVRSILIDGFGEGGIYLIFPGLAGAAYALRYGMRKRMEKDDKDGQKGDREQE